jgi:hypothetical protein
MTEPQSQMPERRPQDPAVPPVAETLDVLREWTDSLAALPFTVLGRGDAGPVVSGKMWVDGTFELVDVWWAVHRRSVEQLLAAQRRTTVQMVDSGWALAEMNRAFVRRSGPAGPRTVPSARR